MHADAAAHPRRPSNTQVWLPAGAEQPRFRTTGMTLLMRVRYTNLRFGEWPSGLGRPRADISIQARSTVPPRHARECAAAHLSPRRGGRPP